MRLYLQDSLLQNRHTNSLDAPFIISFEHLGNLFHTIYSHNAPRLPKESQTHFHLYFLNASLWGSRNPFVMEIERNRDVKSLFGNGRGRIEIRSWSRPERKEVFFEVSDDGPGLTERVKERLFQPFVTTKEQGVGLGLSIVKRIVESHGGRLEVESPRKDMGKGARFVVALPEAKGIA